MTMRNEDLPLIRALKDHAKPKSGAPPLPQFDAPRTFEIQHHELPGLAGHEVGEEISVNLKGHVHSQHNDGHVVMHVSEVKPDTNDMTEKENPDRKTPSESGSVA